MEALENTSEPNLAELAPSDRVYFRPEALEKLTDPKDFHKFINATMKLSDSAFEHAVHDLGYRAANWWMRLGALTGNIRLVKSCEAYLNRIDAVRARSAKPTPVVASSTVPCPQCGRPVPAGEGCNCAFIQPERT